MRTRLKVMVWISVLLFGAIIVTIVGRAVASPGIERPASP